MTRTPVGFALQPDVETLDLVEELVRSEPDYFEVAPETLWRETDDGGVEPNAFHRRFEDLASDTGRFVVAHGVGYSVGSVGTGEDERRAAWRERIAATHAAFGFRWYTDHLGATVLDGLQLALPLPLPMVPAAAAAVRASLAALQPIVADVGVENSAFYHVLGDPADEPAFLAACVDAPGMHVLLDLHNLYTAEVNLGVDAGAYLAALPLERVIEIHVSGGVDSDPAWLGGETLRLDSHDAAVPARVWELLADVAPRCANLRGVTLERMEGTIASEDVDVLRDELRRARALANGGAA